MTFSNTFSFSSANITSNFIGSVAPRTIQTTTTPTLISKIMKRMITKLFHLKMYNKTITATPIALLNKDNVPVKIEKKMYLRMSFLLLLLLFAVCFFCVSIFMRGRQIEEIDVPYQYVVISDLYVRSLLQAIIFKDRVEYTFTHQRDLRRTSY